MFSGASIPPLMAKRERESGWSIVLRRPFACPRPSICSSWPRSGYTQLVHLFALWVGRHCSSLRAKRTGSFRKHCPGMLDNQQVTFSLLFFFFLFLIVEVFYGVPNDVTGCIVAVSATSGKYRSLCRPTSQTPCPATVQSLPSLSLFVSF